MHTQVLPVVQFVNLLLENSWIQHVLQFFKMMFQFPIHNNIPFTSLMLEGYCISEVSSRTKHKPSPPISWPVGHYDEMVHLCFALWLSTMGWNRKGRIYLAPEEDLKNLPRFFPIMATFSKKVKPTNNSNPMKRKKKHHPTSTYYLVLSNKKGNLTGQRFWRCSCSYKSLYPLLSPFFHFLFSPPKGL